MRAGSAQSGPVAVVAPTLFEYAVLSLILPRRSVVWTGIGFSRRQPISGKVIVCGLAGGLGELPSGTVVIPHQVGTESGEIRTCAPELVSVLSAAAHSLGRVASHVPLLTTSSLVTGGARHFWAERGYAAADMETGLLPARITEFATIRVILDTPDRSISAAWASGPRVLTDTRLWRETLWMAGHAPRFTLLAGRIVRAALVQLRAGTASNAALTR
jgi:hypothetical protein